MSQSILDVPNERSSHSRPTPRGGGVGIVIAFLLGSCAMYWEGALSFSDFIGLCGAGGLVALVGFLDDHGHVAARWRLLGHFAAAAWVLCWLGGMPSVELVGVPVSLGWMGELFALFYLVWMLNLYNFMDGIDGIASVQALTVCGSACVLYAVVGQLSLAMAPFLLSAAVAGFLVWNFPPAKIFMGDAGSGFLGLVIGVLALQATQASPRQFWAWLILMGVFIVDATYTLMRRLLRGDRIYEAHRSHGYQFAARRFSHLPVTLGVVVVNSLWLFPIALAATLGWLSGVWAVLLAYLPLVVLAYNFRAGELESQ